MCSEPVWSCRGVDASDEFSFHTDLVRMLEYDDICTRRAAWRQDGVAKADFEEFRKRLLAEDKARSRCKAQRRDDVEAVRLEDEGGQDMGVAPDDDVQKRAIDQNVGRLKREASREPLARCKPILRSPKTKERVPGRETREKARRSPFRSRGRAKGSRASGPHEKFWFGNPRGSTSAGECESKKKKARRRSRSPSKKKKKQKVERDCGPGGVGKAMDFDKEQSDDSAADSGASLGAGDAEAAAPKGKAERRKERARKGASTEKGDPPLAITEMARTVDDNIISAEELPTLSASRDALQSKRYDYAGNPVEYMEDLVAERVIPTWPKVGEAGIRCITDFLDDAGKNAMSDPKKWVLPLNLQPATSKKSVVRASDSEWYKICTELMRVE
eukprot:s264_g16.t1